MKNTTWAFKQEFNIRVSTLVLLSIPVLYLLVLVVLIVPKSTQEMVFQFPLAILSEFQGLIALIGCIFSLALLIISVIKKRPQFQFFVELVIGVLIIFVTPVY